MPSTIEFCNLGYDEFAALKEKIAFTALRLTPDSAAFGENIFTGSIAENSRCFLFEYHDNHVPVVSFIILPAGRKVYYQYADSVSLQTVQSLIKGNITKCCLQEQGNFCLHAAAMCMGDKAILFIGRKGAGKSTLSAYLHLQQHAVWCDDYSVLQLQENSFFVSQGETALKINPEIVTAFNIPAGQIKSVFELPDHWDQTSLSALISSKYYFKRPATDNDIRPRKVAAIFFLHERMPAPQKIITPISKVNAFSILMDEILLPGINSRNYLNTYFQSALQLLEIVPSYHVNSPDDISRIHEVYESILETVS
ncbi:hypothetical protein [Chitinophaga sp. Cy-1792]|uniref:hypothetical protein n=1 Tax=Chitinophaga sp. Cy-1792 TaxID=2608339 RepID=UPI00141EE798|nr:hypothetical protein [Chitinophaga sp. Cy-1792]NIG55370.1 hypothetical protein [Chitinophaga sp. Cy-1792]